MSWRVVFGLMAVIVGSILTGFLLVTEEVTTPEQQEAEASRRDDPLKDMVFSAAQREGNLRRMGFDEAETRAVLTRIDALVQRYRLGDREADLVRARIDASDRQDELAAALCGRQGLPVRYAALAWLVEERGGQRRVIDLGALPRLTLQRWTVEASIAAVVDQAELTPDRNDDATRMALAAILARDEATLLAADAPFGRSTWGGWSWEKVRKKHPGVGEIVQSYVALLHVVLEAAVGESGVCEV